MVCLSTVFFVGAFSVEAWYATSSIRSESLQTIWVSKSKDGGVQYGRLQAQDPFGGVGFIATDGSLWEHLRALLQPSFNRASKTDLPMLESYLWLVSDRISKDRSTIDLQVLFFNLVKSRGISSVKKHVIDTCCRYLDTAVSFLFRESFRLVFSCSGETPTEVQQSLEPFDYAMFGSGVRIALGPLRSLFRDSKWQRACKTTHRFTDYYVNKALQWRQQM